MIDRCSNPAAHTSTLSHFAHMLAMGVAGAATHRQGGCASIHGARQIKCCFKPAAHTPTFHTFHTRFRTVSQELQLTAKAVAPHPWVERLFAAMRKQAATEGRLMVLRPSDEVLLEQLQVVRLEEAPQEITRLYRR